MSFLDILTKPEAKIESIITVDSVFKLPIEYLDDSVVHTLSPIVIGDLELDSAQNGGKSVYEIAMKPQNQYAVSMISRIKNKYTTDIGFLKDSQTVIAATDDRCIDDRCIADQLSVHQMSCPDKIADIWKDLYDVEGFHDRYSFIDIAKFKFINHMSGFMGFWTIANLMSPLISLFLPLVFMIAPFVLLKIQSVPISFSAYLDVLKNIAKSHVIGKTLNSIGSGDFSVNNLLYILFTIALYGMQMYQNVRSCIRFYKNISVVNDRLITMKEFAAYSISNYDRFLSKHRGSLEHYSQFCEDVAIHREYMVQLQEDLATIQPFTFSIAKCFDVGYLLKCYYGLFDTENHKRAFAYAIGFDSYFNLISGLAQNIGAGHISCGSFSESSKTKFINQVYPSHIEREDRVPNTMDLSANVIITGPNASGKTTQLKTTAINIILTQQFGVGFYEECVLTPYTHIHSYLNIPDTSGRDSLFQAEARRCKEILDVIGNEDNDSCSQVVFKHFCVFDELFSGTNAEEATLASFAFLKYLQQFPNVDFILTTHFVKLCQKVEKAGSAMRIANYKMDAELNGNDIVFTYEMVAGISKIKAAKLILIQMGFPDEIIQDMADKK
jgi:hypothetical protein